MRYASLNGGKRFRPFLVVAIAALFDVPRKRALMVGAALECIHCYSLIHDDLPAMDDDDLRRGNPTVHKAFDEATAILAGDGLLTFAFDILGDSTILGKAMGKDAKAGKATLVGGSRARTGEGAAQDPGRRGRGGARAVRRRGVGTDGGGKVRGGAESLRPQASHHAVCSKYRSEAHCALKLDDSFS